MLRTRITGLKSNIYYKILILFVVLSQFCIPLSQLSFSVKMLLHHFQPTLIIRAIFIYQCKFFTQYTMFSASTHFHYTTTLSSGSLTSHAHELTSLFLLPSHTFQLLKFITFLHTFKHISLISLPPVYTISLSSQSHFLYLYIQVHQLNPTSSAPRHYLFDLAFFGAPTSYQLNLRHFHYTFTDYLLNLTSIFTHTRQSTSLISLPPPSELSSQVDVLDTTSFSSQPVMSHRVKHTN